MSVIIAKAIVIVFFRDKIAVLPDRNTIGAPEAAQSPTRQRLARIPLALTKMQ
jgi:hypothetical protein